MLQEFTKLKKELLEQKFNNLNPVQKQVAFKVLCKLLVGVDAVFESGVAFS